MPRSPTIADESGVLVNRIGWSVAAIMLALLGIEAWTGSLSVPSANWASVVMVAGSLVALCWCWAAPRGPGNALQLSVMVGLAVAISYYAVQIWVGQPAYGTDAVAFDQYAAQLTLHGTNPYGVSMAPALELFHVPVIFHTFQLDGASVTRLSYPAGSFLAYVPLLALGVKAQAGNIVDLAFWVAGMFLLWRLLPANLRWAAAIVMSAGTYLSYIFGGVTDTLYIPFVIAALYRWDRFGDSGERTWVRWAGPVLLGVAMSMKQTPWFLLPFLVLGVGFEARARGAAAAAVRTSARYAVLAIGTFALINLPFIVLTPAAWAKDSLVPFLTPTIPDGQGLVDLALYEHLGGGRLSYFTLAGALFFLFGLALFAVHYERLKRAWVPLLLFSFFFPTRSLGSYLIMLLPAVMVAATTVRTPSASSFPALAGRRWWLFGPLLAATGGAAIAALAATAPLEITILGTRSTGQLLTIDQVSVRVTNRLAHPIRPHFSVNEGGSITTFWYPYRAGHPYQLDLAPGASRTLTLQVPNAASEPSIISPFTVDAFTVSPASVSVSQRYLVSPLSLSITPPEIDQPVPLGHSVTFSVQLQNQLGSQVQRGGLRVDLGQVIYAQSGLLPAEASIDGHGEGTTPVTAITDRHGRATFTVVGVQAQPAPVYFQAWIATPGQVPHSYSNLVLVQFVR
jgi:uncharacterized membrane protein